MSYEFTKLSDVPAVDEFPEGANAIIETNGEIKRCPSSNTPKPLTYDYMPEGYPRKSVQTTTLIEEQELAFALEDKAVYSAYPNEAPEVVEGQTYTVNWDGAEYECVCSAPHSMPSLGNLSIAGTGNDTGEPFIYVYNTEQAAGVFGTHDTSASHTISVKTTGEMVTPMAEEFLPDNLATKSDVAVVRNTANAAQTTAENAQTTAENAQTTAENAQNTANAAHTTATNARTTANAAQTTANDAKNAAENARTTANDAKTKVAQALTVSSTGDIEAPTNAMGYGTYQTLRLNSKDSYHSSSFGVTESIGLQIFVGRDGGLQSNVSNPSTVEFKSNGGLRVRLKGIDELILKSSTTDSTKQFKITVDDSGTISATEVT